MHDKFNLHMLNLQLNNGTTNNISLIIYIYIYIDKVDKSYWELCTYVKLIPQYICVLTLHELKF